MGVRFVLASPGIALSVVFSYVVSFVDYSSLLASKLSKSLHPCALDGSANSLSNLPIVFSFDLCEFLHVVSDLLSIWHHLSFHGLVSFLQVLLERMGSVTPDATHVLNLSHVDVDGQLSSLDDAHESNDDSEEFHFSMFYNTNY